jgi:hypothetical protein
VVIETPSDAEVEAVLKEKPVLIGRASCTARGGAVPECDEGAGKAHHCQNSKWGKLRTFGGPCLCGCHSLKA